MQYVWELSVAPINTVSNPAVLPMNIPTGIVRAFHVMFRSGAGGLVRCLIADGSVHISPANPESFYSLDDGTVDAPLNYDVSKGNRQLVAYGWNIGISNIHVVTITVDVEAIDDIGVNALQKSFLALFTRFIDLMRGMF